VAPGEEVGVCAELAEDGGVGGFVFLAVLFEEAEAEEYEECC